MVILHLLLSNRAQPFPNLEILKYDSHYVCNHLIYKTRSSDPRDLSPSVWLVWPALLWKYSSSSLTVWKPRLVWYQVFSSKYNRCSAKGWIRYDTEAMLFRWTLKIFWRSAFGGNYWLWDNAVVEDYWSFLDETIYNLLNAQHLLSVYTDEN